MKPIAEPEGPPSPANPIRSTSPTDEARGRDRSQPPVSALDRETLRRHALEIVPDTPSQVGTQAVSATPTHTTSPLGTRANQVPDSIAARMLNEFVYCPRLFYYEFVEGVFMGNADTERGVALHPRVDQGAGAVPPPSPANPTPADTASANSEIRNHNSEILHSRSVQLGSKTLGVTAKLDLLEIRGLPPDGFQGELFGQFEVCPVDYKAGAPRDGEDTRELWPADRMQLGLQMLLLRENGYTCREGMIV